MSINESNFDLVERIFSLMGSNRSFKLLELGNQMILKGKDVAYVAKDYFGSKGVKHTSFDINSLNGAIAIDLSQPLPKNYFNQFDVVTNFGTTEHIEDQHQVFCNIHDACKVGGYMVHSLPEDGFWIGHSPYHYKPEFPAVLSAMNDYSLIHLAFPPRRRERFINFIAQKKSSKSFVFDSKWSCFSKNYKRNTDNRF